MLQLQGDLPQQSVRIIWGVRWQLNRAVSSSKSSRILSLHKVPYIAIIKELQYVVLSWFSYGFPVLMVSVFKPVLVYLSLICRIMTEL